VFDAKADNQRKLVSCLRTGIKLGAWPKGGNGEPLATVNALMNIRQKLKQNPADAKRLQDAANTLLKYAREQLKRDTLIDEDELRSFCFKPNAKDPSTAEEVLENIRKQLDKLVKGNNHGVRDTSAEVIAARGELQKRLSAIAKAKNPQIVQAAI
jgi:ATP/maltotriose-dependent transcriptional regulator MalT